jgi:hypothetical protein
MHRLAPAFPDHEMHDVPQTGAPSAENPPTSVDARPAFVPAKLGVRIDAIQYIQHARPPSARVNERYFADGGPLLHLRWREDVGAAEDDIWREHNLLAKSPSARRSAWERARRRYIAMRQDCLAPLMVAKGETLESSAEAQGWSRKALYTIEEAAALAIGVRPGPFVSLFARRFELISKQARRYLQFEDQLKGLQAAGYIGSQLSHHQLKAWSAEARASKLVALLKDVDLLGALKPPQPAAHNKKTAHKARYDNKVDDWAIAMIEHISGERVTWANLARMADTYSGSFWDCTLEGTTVPRAVAERLKKIIHRQTLRDHLENALLRRDGPRRS